MHESWIYGQNPNNYFYGSESEIAKSSRSEHEQEIVRKKCIRLSIAQVQYKDRYNTVHMYTVLYRIWMKL